MINVFGAQIDPEALSAVLTQDRADKRIPIH